MKKVAAALLAGGMVLAAFAPANAAKPKTIWEDNAGDADVGQGLGQSIPGGWDLVSGTVVKKGKNLDMTVTHADMPPMGSGPEATRFLWNFTINGEPYRLTAKSADIGKPDVLAQSGTERVGTVSLEGHFRIEGECFTDTTLPVQMVNCPVVGYYDGVFDPASMSFTANIPLKDLKAKRGSVFGPGMENICQICWVTHYAERSLNTTIIDSAGAAATYKIPKK